MKLFRSYYPNNVLYLTPVKLGNEQLPEDKIRMLLYDTRGEVYASLVDKTSYECAKKHIRKMKRNHKNYATLGIEISRGKSLTFVVEISAEELWALERIQAHALKRRNLPNVLKRYLQQIIKIGEAECKVSVVKNETAASQESKPKVLENLPYYYEGDAEISVPIYKAEHRYPLIVLKRLTSNEYTPQDMERVLNLDSDGDLVVIRVPFEIVDKAQRDIEKWQSMGGQCGCVICSRGPEGLIMSYMAISKLQRVALDKIIKSFEETGFGTKPVSTVAQEILVKAKDEISLILQ